MKRNELVKWLLGLIVYVVVEARSQVRDPIMRLFRGVAD
jgi:hypothetical protein